MFRFNPSLSLSLSPTTLIGRINLRSVGARTRGSHSRGAHLFSCAIRRSGRAERPRCARRRSAVGVLFCLREPEVRVGRFYRTGHSCARYVRTSVRPSVLSRVLYFAFRDIRAASATGSPKIARSRIHARFYLFFRLSSSKSVNYITIFFVRSEQIFFEIPARDSFICFPIETLQSESDTCRKVTISLAISKKK